MCYQECWREEYHVRVLHAPVREGRGCNQEVKGLPPHIWAHYTLSNLDHFLNLLKKKRILLKIKHNLLRLTLVPKIIIISYTSEY